MPVIYVADWLRGSTGWLGIELCRPRPLRNPRRSRPDARALVPGGGDRRARLLGATIAPTAPGQTSCLWDLAHYQRSDYVPDWYAVGCAVIDVAVGLYAAVQVRRWTNRSGNRTSASATASGR